jgi:hypothetical protein
MSHQSRSVHARPLPRPSTRASITGSQPPTRISFDRNFNSVAASCKGAPSAGPACRSSDASVLTALVIALVIAVEPQQPGYLSHGDGAAAPVDRFPYRQTLVVGHCA